VTQRSVTYVSAVPGYIPIVPVYRVGNQLIFHCIACGRDHVHSTASGKNYDGPCVPDCMNWESQYFVMEVTKEQHDYFVQRQRSWAADES
jgi:hypothetical protein